MNRQIGVMPTLRAGSAGQTRIIAKVSQAGAFALLSQHGVAFSNSMRVPKRVRAVVRFCNRLRLLALTSHFGDRITYLQPPFQGRAVMPPPPRSGGGRTR